jgi:hypothetical protein
MRGMTGIRMASVLALAAVSGAVLVAAGAPAQAERARPAAGEVRMDTEGPVAVGLNGTAVPFTVTLHNGGAAQPRTRLDVQVRPNSKEFFADSYHVAFQDPATKVWKPLALAKGADGLRGRTGEFAVPAGLSTLNLRFDHTTGPGAGGWDPTRSLEFRTALEAVTGTGAEELAVSSAYTSLRQPYIYFANPPAALRADGSTVLKVRYVNDTQSTYPAIAPEFMIGPRPGLTEGNTKLEWRNPATGRWERIALAHGVNDYYHAQFTAAQKLSLGRNAEAEMLLRLTFGEGFTGPMQLDVRGRTPNAIDFDGGKLKTVVR